MDEVKHGCFWKPEVDFKLFPEMKQKDARDILLQHMDQKDHVWFIRQSSQQGWVVLSYIKDMVINNERKKSFHECRLRFTDKGWKLQSDKSEGNMLPINGQIKPKQLNDLFAQHLEQNEFKMNNLIHFDRKISDTPSYNWDTPRYP